MGTLADLAQETEELALAVAEAMNGKQPLDADLTAISGLSTTPYGRSLLALANQAALQAEVAAPPHEPKGRLTLTSGTPVTTSDVSSATTVYYTPHTGGHVPLYGGSSFTMTPFSELSQATTDTTKSPAAVGNNLNYDVFVWNDAGTVRATRGPAWSSDTSRGTGAGTTELTRVNGILLNANAITNGPAAQRGTYVGTFRSNGSAQIFDTAAFRYLFNAYNRVTRGLKVTEGTATWDYTTSTFRPFNNSTANALNYVDGLGTVSVNARVLGTASNTSAGVAVAVGIGVDSTSSNSADITGACTTPVASYLINPTAEYEGVPGLGKHTLTALEWSGGSGTTTWRGNNGLGTIKCGIVGRALL